MAGEGWGTDPTLEHRPRRAAPNEGETRWTQPPEASPLCASPLEHRPFDQPEIWKLLEHEPWQFEFFQAVRLLERVFADRPRVGYFFPPSSEVVHFGAASSTAFPASDIASIQKREDNPPKMTVNFIGLTGPNGVLPAVYDELIETELRDRKSRTLPEFLDIFNHRITSLFYRAWSKYRFETGFERGEPDLLSRCLLALVGLGTSGLQKRQKVIDDVLLYYSGLIGAHQRSAIGLKQILAEYFGVDVEIEQFAGRWRRLSRHACTFLNETNRPSEQLGYGTVVGDEMWDPQSNVRIRLGPLTMEQYIDFLPHGSAYEPLRAIVRFYSGNGIDFEAQLVLKHEEVPACELGSESESGPRLGWVTWIKSTPTFDRNPMDTVFEL